MWLNGGPLLCGGNEVIRIELPVAEFIAVRFSGSGEFPTLIARVYYLGRLDA